MSRIVVLEDRCKGCLLCTTVCPKHILRQSQTFNHLGYQVVEMTEEADKCTGCASCGIICPDVALRVFKTPAKSKGERA